jgi:uncharacterized protein (TIGR00251 family)
VTPPVFLREQDGAVVLALKVQPRASRNEIAGPLGQELKLKVMAPPVDSAANEAVVEFLAKLLGLPRRAVSLVRGQTSPHKLIRLDGISLTDAAQKLT